MIFAKIICFISVAELLAISCDEIFFIAKEYENNQYFCVTNGSSAITWIDTDIKSKISDTAVSSFFPQLPNSKCSESELEFWRCESSFSNNIITDHRWESFNIHHTRYDRFSNLEFKTVAENLKQDFSIPLSIRIEQEAHVLFCDGPNVTKSNCYWFILMGFSGNKTAVRKCPTGTISLKQGETPKEPCASLKKEIPTNTSGKFLSNNEWRHFHFKKFENTIILTDFSSKPIIQYTDEKPEHVVNHMIIHSKQDGLWKLHKSNYYRTEQTNVTEFQKPLNPINNVVCISTFLRMCQKCTIKFEFRSANENYHILKETEFTFTTLDWKEIKFHVSDVESPAKLLITTIKPRGEKNPFWELDDIRQCSSEGFRIIKSKNASNCQLLSNPTKVLNFTEKSSLALKQKPDKCSEDTIGTYCIPCSLFSNTTLCGKLKICQKYEASQNCYCGAGYQMNSTNECMDECEHDSYGNQCQYKCPRQCGNCNKVTEKCTSCKNGYTGYRCLILPSQNLPKVLKSTYTEAVIRVPQIKIDSDNDESFKECSFQYKVADKSTYMWTPVEKSYNCNDEKNFTIKDLRPGLQYFARVTVSFKDKWQDFYEFFFSPECDVAKLDDFQIQSSNTSINLSVNNKVRNKLCPLNTAAIKVEIEPRDQTFSYYFYKSFSCRLNGLKPSTNYSVALRNRTSGIPLLKLDVKTTEGIPEKIANIELTKQSSTQISLKWIPSNQDNHEHYIILYEVQFHLGCGSSNPKNPTEKTNEQSTEKTFIDLMDLIPFTNYKISVAAKNKKFQGPFTTVNFTTTEAENVSQDEIPKLESNVEQNRSIKFKFSIDCKKNQGPSFIKISAICLDSWCKNLTQKYDNNPETEVNFQSLMPYTNYLFNFKLCRNKSCRLFEKKKVKTKPEPANVAQNFSVYTKNESSISVRWTPPYPPSGVVELYQLIFQFQGLPGIKKNVTNSTCKLWANFQCFTMNNLEKNKNYSINIQAKNRNVGLGQNHAINALTKIEPSGPPIDLKLRWSLKNDLKISWKHPVAANGDIQFFKVSVLPHNEKINNIVRIVNLSSRYDYKPIYHYTINGTQLLPSKKYKVKVSAYNGFEGNEIYVEDLSPPEIPTFTTNPKMVLLNETIRVETSNIQDFQSSHYYKLFLFLEDEKLNETFSEKELIQFERSFDIRLYNLKLLYKCNRYENSTEFIVGKAKNSPSTCEKFANITLIPGKKYNVTIMLVHNVGNNNKSSYKLYTDVKFTTEVPASGTLLPLLSLLLIVPIVIFIFLKRHQIIEKITSIHHDDIETLKEDGGLTAVLIPTLQKSEKIHSKIVTVSELEHYVKESLENDELDRQHALFPRGLIHPCECGATKENKPKNRYTNLVAYDHTRVVLTKIKNQPNSDYINANYIDGYKVPKAYIATQGPKISTTCDFWRMIWQENVRHIIMLANIFEGKKKKVEKYWPENNKSLDFNDITVYYTSTEVFADYQHRIFRVVCEEETREIHQYHFLSWPDHGVPLYCQSLVPLLENIHSIPLNSKSPMLVHCSAGVGRTGTILLCDICLRMATETKTVDILRTLQQLRDQRPNMVDNVHQYKFAHLVILEYLHGLKTAIPCNGINVKVKELIENEEVKKQMQYLEEKKWQDEAMKSAMTKDEKFFMVAEKNRFQTIVPDAYNNIYISRFPINDPTSTYINAVKVDGFQCRSRFIVTQQPLPNTVGDFWRLVDEKNISVIISLNEVNRQSKTTCQFWPAKTNEELAPIEFITLKNTNISSLDVYDSISVQLHVTGKEDYKSVEIMAFKNWKPKKNCPKNLEDFLSFCEDSQAVSRQSNPVLITCFDGALASGLYVALTFIVEKMKVEQICDVCQAVRAVRQNRREFVQNEEQFEFLYKAAVAYIDSFQIYANFN